VGNPRIDELRSRIARDPASRLLPQLAEELRKDGALGEAIEVCREALKRHPSHSSAHLTLGRCLLETGDARAAVAELQVVVAGAADNILALRLLAEAQEAARDPAAAAESYAAALRLSPGDKQLAARLEALASKASASATPSTAPPRDRFAPVPLVEMDPLELFELESAGGIPLGGPPPVEPAPAVAGEVPAAKTPEPPAAQPEEPPQTIRVRRPVLVAEGPAAALEAAFAAEIERAAPVVAATVPVAAATDLASVTLAELYRSQGALDKATETCLEVLRRDPGNARAQALLAEFRVQAQGTLGAPGDRRAVLESTIRRLEGFLDAVKRG
jgi:predicted Zn-dependent protease